MTATRIDLAGGAWLVHRRSWMAAVEADELLRALRDALPWESREVFVFGRWVRQPRLIAWAGDLPYRYSGQTLPARPWPPALSRVLGSLERDSQHSFNHVLVNRYRDGSDSMGLHADDEPELGPDPVVASVSLGHARRFVVRGRSGGAESFDLVLEHGSLLVMGGTFQRRYRHGVPKNPKLRGERISLTFRRVLVEPG